MTALPRMSQRRASERRVRLTVELLEDRTVPSNTPIGGALLQATPNDPSFGQLYGLQRIQAQTAWNVSTGSTSVVVADVDSGADYAHPDLYKNIWINQGELPQSVIDVVGVSPVTFHELNRTNPDGSLVFAQWDQDLNNRIDGTDALALWSDDNDADQNGYRDDLIGWNFVAGSNNPMDDNGHGTHTAGTIGALGNNGLGVVGVNWQVQIMPLKFIAGDGTGSLDWAAAAIRYAVDNGASVSNNSWIYYGGTSGDVVYQAVAYAESHQHLVIAAAGNDGFNNDASIWRSYPASFSLGNIIAVAATDTRDAKPNWSNYGKTSVDLGAPGVSILSTVPVGAYGFGSGTSMATPHVTGVAALILAARPDLAGSPALVKSLILNNVDKVKALSNKTVTGGRLNAAKALSAALTANPSGASPSPGGGKGQPGGAQSAVAAMLDLQNFHEAALSLLSIDGVLCLSRFSIAPAPDSQRPRINPAPVAERTLPSLRLHDGYLLLDLLGIGEPADEGQAGLEDAGWGDEASGFGMVTANLPQ